MFYELNTSDPLGASPWKRSTDGPMNGTFNGDIDTLVQAMLLAYPDAQLVFPGDGSTSSSGSVTAAADMKVGSSVSDFEIPNLVPDG